MERTQTHSRPRAKALLVEDSPIDAALFSLWLTNDHPLLEFDVSVATSLEETSVLLQSEQFDVVLLDLCLTDSSGLETLTSIVRERNQIPILVLTGINDDGIALEAVRAGAQDFLVKGEFDEKLLRRSIRYSMERHRLEQDRKSLSRQLLTVLGDEQQRIARELHDEVGQGLSGLNMIARSLVRRLRETGLPEASKAGRISEGIQDTLDSFRRVLTGLSPVNVDAQGLYVALQRLCDTINNDSDDATCTFEGPVDLRVSDNNIATHLYRIAQESLTNARKHARSSRYCVRLRKADSRLVLTVEDDGIGFDPQVCQGRGMGLRILRHRSELIGGTLSINSGPAGTMVRCEVPNEL